MSKAKRRGRASRDGKHVRDYEWMLDSAAYRSLDCVQRCLLHELKRLYSGTNNGQLFLSVRRAAALVGVNKDTARGPSSSSRTADSYAPIRRAVSNGRPTPARQPAASRQRGS
jgi:hypothetical protein